MLSRIVSTNAKWIICDPASLEQVKSATKVVGWPVEIILFGHEDGVTSVDEIFEDDGEGILILIRWYPIRNSCNCFNVCVCAYRECD